MDGLACTERAEGAVVKLNAEQWRAVEHVDGPLLVKAGPGSGKTRVIAYRTARLIERGVPPYRILLVTFTRKASAEMRERIASLVGAQRSKQIAAGTFHSICARLLRSFEDNASRAGRKADFTIYDESASQAVVRKAIAELELDKKQWKYSEVRERISLAKGRAQTPEQIVLDGDADTATWQKLWQRYEALLQVSNAFDFDDLLVVATLAAEADNALGRALRGRYQYVLVDEYQDTDPIQFRLAKALSSSTGNLCAVGDYRQCIPAGQMIYTPKGRVPIEDVQVGDEVLAVRAGRAVPARVLRKNETKKGEAFEFDLGKYGEMQATAEHVMFAAIDNPRGAFVYLMYRHDLGYRLGVSRTVDRRGRNFVVRTQQEGGERLWVLEWFPRYAQAAEREAFLAYKFAVPREPFKVRPGMWSNTEEATRRLFKEFGSHGAYVLKSYGLSFARPNYVAKATRRGRVAINLLLSGRDGHRVEVETAIVGATTARRVGMLPTKKGGYRRRSCFRGVADARECADDLATKLDGYVVESLACVGGIGRRMLAVPAASVNVGMQVPVLGADGRLVVADVLGRRVVPTQRCFDLEVENAGTFVVGGVVVHNSIYSFRGADVTNILSFTKHYPDATVVDLDANYRSTVSIVGCFNSLLNGSAVYSVRGNGAPVQVRRRIDSEDEAANIVRELEREMASGASLGECAVLYRNHHLSRALETTCRHAGVPYQMARRTSFYERKTVRNALAYLRLTENPDSDVDLERIINIPPRAMGDPLMEKVRGQKRGSGATLLECLGQLAAEGKISGKTRENAAALVAMFAQAREMAGGTGEGRLVKAANHIMDASGYRKYLARMLAKHEKDGDKEKCEEDNQMIWLLDEVVNDVHAYERRRPDGGLMGYLEHVALMSDQDSVEGNGVVLSTIHASKGLEFRRVWVVGVESGLLPSYRAATIAEVDEERRLLFVACSRAKDTLALSYVCQRMIRGEYRAAEPSPFLRDLPVEYVNWPMRPQELAP